MRCIQALFICVFCICGSTSFVCEADTGSDEGEIGLLHFYEKVIDKPIWFNDKELNTSGVSAMQLLSDLGIELVDIEDKYVDLAKQISLKELKITYAILSVLSRRAESMGNNVQLTKTAFIKVINRGEVNNYINEILPPYADVVRLRHMIREYQEKLTIFWPNLAEVDIRLGQSSVQIKKLRSMLTFLGDLDVKKQIRYRDSIFDPNAIEAVKYFQQRHGIEVSGIVDSKTLAAINISPRKRLSQMQDNLWRLAQLPKQVPDKYIWINIPDYSLMLFDKGSESLNMRVIVGKPMSPTPRLNTTLTQITVNPSWTPPHSIVKNELLPLHAHQPGYLNHQGFALHKTNSRGSDQKTLSIDGESNLTVLLKDYRLVQQPGKANALGKLRFSISNQQSIFLHDTPDKSLFALTDRALSHGCIRLSAPVLLSSKLLDDEAVALKFEQALDNRDTRHFSVMNSVPTIITYQTAWVDKWGVLQIRPDIYQMDREI